MEESTGFQSKVCIAKIKPSVRFKEVKAGKVLAEEKS
jgi:hypothetical protein